MWGGDADDVFALYSIDVSWRKAMIASGILCMHTLPVLLLLHRAAGDVGRHEELMAGMVGCAATASS